MRARFTIMSDGTVSVIYSDVLGVRLNRQFFCPVEGGYVRERMVNDYTQVCERLSHTGHTLMSTRGTLLNDIRREYRAMKRNDNKYTRGYP